MSAPTEDWHLQDDDLPPPLNIIICPISAMESPTQGLPQLSNVCSVASLMNSPHSTYTSAYHDPQLTYTTLDPIPVVTSYPSTLDFESSIEPSNDFSDDPMPAAMPLPYQPDLNVVYNLADSIDSNHAHSALEQSAYSKDTDSFNNFHSRSPSPLYLNAPYIGNAFQPGNIPYSVNPQHLCCTSSIDTQYMDQLSTFDSSSIDWNESTTSINARYQGIHSIATTHHFCSTEPSSINVNTVLGNSLSSPSRPLTGHPLTLHFQDPIEHDCHTPWLIERSSWSTIDEVPNLPQMPPAQHDEHEQSLKVSRDQIHAVTEASLSEANDSAYTAHCDLQTSDISLEDATPPTRRVLPRRGSLPVQVEQQPPPSDPFRRGHTRAISDTSILESTSSTSLTDTFQDGSLKICSNCRTTVTPSWRRCAEGKRLLCNACGLYQKLHRIDRPIYQAADGKIKVRRAPHGSTVVQTVGYTEDIGGTRPEMDFDTAVSYPVGSSPTTISCHSSDDSASDSAAPNTPEASDVCGICNQGKSSMRTIMQSDCTKGLICNLCAMAKAYCDSFATAMSMSDNETTIDRIHDSDPAASSRDGSYDSDVEIDLAETLNAEHQFAAEGPSPSSAPNEGLPWFDAAANEPQIFTAPMETTKEHTPKDSS